MTNFVKPGAATFLHRPPVLGGHKKENLVDSVLEKTQQLSSTASNSGGIKLAELFCEFVLSFARVCPDWEFFQIEFVGLSVLSGASS